MEIVLLDILYIFLVNSQVTQVNVVIGIFIIQSSTWGQSSFNLYLNVLKGVGNHVVDTYVKL